VAQEALAPGAIEQHVEPGEGYVGAGMTPSPRHDIHAQKLSSAGRALFVQALEEELR
jgi:hypothetical protein